MHTMQFFVVLIIRKLRKVKNMLTNCKNIGQNNRLKFVKKKKIHVHVNKKSNDFVNFAMDNEIKANYCFYSILTNIIFECT